MPTSRYPDWKSFKITPKARAGPVAFCADLSPDSLLSACQHGIFPFPAPDEYARDVNEFSCEDQVSDGVIGLVGGTHDDPYWVGWWSPDPRPVIKVADNSFQRVAEECRAGREPRWLTDTLLESMVRLHETGWAHSIEVWQEGDLIGGAIGIGIGLVLSGDSMFSRRPGAARIAVADMAARFAQAGGALIDAQWDSPFLRSLGAELMPRDQYLTLLAGSAERRALPLQPLPARRLLGGPVR